MAQSRSSFRVLIAAVLLCGMPASAQRKRAVNPPTVSVCELFKDLRSYAGKMVSVRGLLYSGRETFALGGPCESRFTTRYSPATPAFPSVAQRQLEYVWPAAVDLADAAMVTRGEEPVDFQTDDEMVNQAYARNNSEQARLGGAEKTRVWVTVVGKLRVRDHYDVVQIADGTWLGIGYGHLGMYPGQLVIKTMADPLVERKKD